MLSTGLIAGTNSAIYASTYPILLRHVVIAGLFIRPAVQHTIAPDCIGSSRFVISLPFYLLGYSQPIVVQSVAKFLLTRRGL